MGLVNYLLDTNFILYLLKGKTKPIELKDCDKIYISFITKIELLSYSLSEKQKEAISKILLNYEIIYIDDNLINKTINIRKQHSLKIPDAIIVASAITKNANLITADKQIINKANQINLKIINPLF